MTDEADIEARVRDELDREATDRATRRAELETRARIAGERAAEAVARKDAETKATYPFGHGSKGAGTDAIPMIRRRNIGQTALPEDAKP